MESSTLWNPCLPLWLSVSVAAVLGLSLGGFYTVCIQRYVAGAPLLRPLRSHCPHCHALLGWRETIPLLGFMLARGRCRHCGASIGLRYVAVELVSLAWALALVFTYGLSLPWLVYMVFGGLFIVGSFIDLELYILPNRITLGGAALALAVQAAFGWPAFKGALLGAMAGGGFFWLLQQVYRIVRKEEGLGTGDVKLMLCIGALVGVGGLKVTLVLSTVFIFFAALFNVIIFRRSGLTKILPFGPFLCLGAMLHILVGHEVLAWYLSLYR